MRSDVSPRGLHLEGETAMIEEYAVKGENPDGVVVILRRGFASKNDAEDYRVIMSQWRRIWIERLPASDCGPSGIAAVQLPKSPSSAS
jgi:hypothetical protein